MLVTRFSSNMQRVACFDSTANSLGQLNGTEVKKKLIQNRFERSAPDTLRDILGRGINWELARVAHRGFHVAVIGFNYKSKVSPFRHLVPVVHLLSHLSTYCCAKSIAQLISWTSFTSQFESMT